MAAGSTDYVVLRDATFHGSRGPVFAGTTWRLPADEHWAIRGASGAGKSLFVAAICGVLPRLRGALSHPFLAGDPRYADSVFGILPPGSIAIASMDQHRAVLAGRAFHQLRWTTSLLSGAMPVAEFLSYRSVTRRNPFVVIDPTDPDEARFESVSRRERARWDLDALLDRPLVALSNGELHRLLVARALLLAPRLLIVDDPYAGLDLRTRARLTETLAALPAEGTGVLYVAARDEDVPRTVTHELEIAAGAVVYAGPRRSVPPRVPRPRTARSPAGRGTEPAVVLELRDVSVHLGGRTILDRVSLTVRVGERWALVGPNGSGKSTVLSLILADNPQAYRNHVAVCGVRLAPGTSVWDVKRRLGWVSPELDAHYPAATTLVDVVISGFRSSLGAYAPRDADSVAAAQVWLRRVGLADHGASPFGRLPRVEQRLAFLARACVHAPALLLLDEPCQGLDGPDRSRFAAALDECLAALNAALIYVTHEAAELPPGVEHVLALDGPSIMDQQRMSGAFPL